MAAAEAARRKGDPLGLYDIVSGALASGEDQLRLRYLHVLALAQIGDLDRAERLYADYRLAEAEDEDCRALGGRLAKDRARLLSGSERAAWFARASDAYAAAYALRGGYFPAINAASTAWAAGERDRAADLARRVLDHQEVRAPSNFYAFATRAEALLLLGREAAAGEAVEEALRTGGAGDGERASASGQLRWLHEEGLGGDATAALVARLRPPPVLTFCGHMFSDRGPTDALRAAIGAELDRIGCDIGYGALACGADILIAEALLERGGELHVVLPFAIEDFRRHSVLPGGKSWDARFERCMAAASSLHLASRMGHIGHDDQFSYGSLLAMGLARVRARQLCTDALQLAVWDGTPPAGPAGTARDVAAWRQEGGETIVVAPGPVDRGLARLAGPAYSGPPRVLRAIIFTDFAGFSKLSESALPAFWREIMGRIGAILERRADRICGRNTWGDALFAVVEDAPAAAEIAIEIRDGLRDADFADVELAAGEGMRIGIHFGPVYEEGDPVTGATTHYGSEVTLAARIEPRVPTGEIYVTEPFAAILASTAPDRFASHYVGRIALAKNYGEWPIYRLARA